MFSLIINKMGKGNKNRNKTHDKILNHVGDGSSQLSPSAIKLAKDKIRKKTRIYFFSILIQILFMSRDILLSIIML